jgi:C4-dicarboxylate transporter DctM subunit
METDVTGLVIIIIAFVLMFLGFPIFVALGLGGLGVALVSAGFTISSAADFFFININSWVLLAIPLFIFAGYIMLHGGTAAPLLDLMNSFVGRVPGSLAVASIVFCAVFGALSGSSMGAAAAVGSMMIPSMRAEGYGDDEATGVIATAAFIDNLIPPAAIMILYAALVETSVGKLFIAGIVPGIVLCVMLAITAIIIAVRRRRKGKPGVNWKTRGKAFVKAIPALFMPVIVLGGIYGGIFTPTEAAAVACVYAILVGFFIYRKLTLPKFWQTLQETIKATGMLFVIMVGATLFGKMFIFVGIPQAITGLVIGASVGPNVILALSVLLLIILGCIMDPICVLYISVPLLLPTMTALGLDPIHFGIIMVVATGVGTITPPVGVMVWFVAGISKVDPMIVLRGALPYLIVMIIFLFFIVYFPEISLWLPGTMMH